MICFLDMDGILTDFNAHVLKTFRVSEEEVKKEWTPGNWDMVPAVCKIKGLSKPAFWESLSPEWWETMPLTDEAPMILELAKKHFWTDVYILTAPANASSAAGKLMWIKKVLPELYYGKRYVLCKKKGLVAQKHHLLVDDSDDNVDAFSKGGGRTILYPRYWNSHNDLISPNVLETFDMFKKQFESVVSEMKSEQ